MGCKLNTQSKICSVGPGTIAKLVCETRFGRLISLCRCFRVGRITARERQKYAKTGNVRQSESLWKSAKLKILSNTLDLIK
jgi:hypothetical protein